MAVRPLRTAPSALVLVLLAVTGCAAGTPVEDGADRPAVAAPSAGPPSPDLEAGARIEGVRTYPYTPPDHQAADIDYAQSPPVGGTHWPPSAEGVTGWLTCGVYESSVPDEFAVHSMEHGAVWLTYAPGADATALEELAQVQPDYVLVSPYPRQEGYAATTYGAQLFVDSPDDPRLEQFVRAYAGGPQGREPGAPCTGGSTPQQAQEALEAVSD